MTIEEFFYWLKGFAAAANSYNVTPAQWETVKQKLEEVEVKDKKHNIYPLSHGGYDVVNTTADNNLFVGQNKTILND